MRKLNRGFTLIELLVVVAIIGILASVGVVAYNGYTESAKKAGVASNHANIMKVIGADLAKCNIDDTTFRVEGAAADATAGTDAVTASSLDCSSITSGDVATAAISYFTAKTKEFKNPYNTPGSVAVAGDAPVKGQTAISDDGSTATVKSCKVKEETGCTEIIEGTVSIN